ncbi:response regulator [Ketogulonicigenium vulgare]|uniref:response regulator n=1 Tax=Ketogulonicigenium vulgare TaxID=92945 RepID=UPI002359D29D|nr:response regulator [Ketogulonicigenium vulgare]
MPNRNIRFLLVDDIRDNMVALEALLRRDGLEVDMAGSAPEALEMMLLRDYQLAFVDVHMPDINGYELAELMRGTERTREIPIIFVTAAERNETRRFRGYEAGGVDYIFKPIDPVMLKSKAEVFYRIARQAKELEAQRDELRGIARDRDLAIASLRAHANNSPLALVECDADLSVRGWSEGAERLFGIKQDDVIGRTLNCAGCFDQSALDMLHNWVASLDHHARHTAEILATSPGGPLNCEIYGSVLTDPALGRTSLSLQILDVTERHRAEEVRSLLVGELNHRIKNTLANVQAIMRQTLRTSGDLKEFGGRFSGRLQALARAHSILSNVTWSSASMDEVIDDQIKAGTLDNDSLHREGPKIALSPENTLRLALVLHELGTNATKYGALSTPDGHVTLKWQIEGEDLVLEWRESGGPPVSQPQGKGFGSSLIATGFGDSRASVDWRPEGVVWTIKVARGFERMHSPRAIAVPHQQPAPTRDAAIAGLRVLVVEDEPLVAMDISLGLEEGGATIVAVARSLDEAVRSAQLADVDVALLDGNLAGDPVDQVARILHDRGVPFCFVSGYGREHLPTGYPDAPILAKPASPDMLLSTLRKITSKKVLANAVSE